MNTSVRIATGFPALAFLVLSLFANSPNDVVHTNGPVGSEIAMKIDKVSIVDNAGMNGGPIIGDMDIGSKNSLQSQVSKIIYPLTAIAALFTVWILGSQRFWVLLETEKNEEIGDGIGSFSGGD